MAPARHRVLHLITRLELGGAQQNTLFCAEHHDRSRFEVDLLAGQGGILDGDAQAIPDTRVRLLPYLRHPIAPLADLLAVFRLRSYFRSRRIDLVHTHSSKAGILGRLAAFLAGVPVVIHTVHGWSFNETQASAVRRAYVTLERWAAPLTDRLIAVSARNRDKGLGLSIGRQERYEVLHSGIDLSRWRRPVEDHGAARAALGLGPEHVVVGTLSVMKPQKAPLDFVRTAKAAHAEDPRLRFVFAGDGPLRGEVESLIDDMGLHDVVRLLGWRRDVERWLGCLDVFLLTSLFEGLPRAVLQAMAAGVPVIATDVDGTPEVVEHGVTGRLVPPGRPDLAAGAVLEAVAEPERNRRMVSQAQRRLTDRFDIHRMVDRLDDLYLSLLES